MKVRSRKDTRFGTAARTSSPILGRNRNKSVPLQLVPRTYRGRGVSLLPGQEKGISMSRGTQSVAELPVRITRSPKRGAFLSAASSALREETKQTGRINQEGGFGEQAISRSQKRANLAYILKEVTSEAWSRGRGLGNQPIPRGRVGSLCFRGKSISAKSQLFAKRPPSEV